MLGKHAPDRAGDRVRVVGERPTAIGDCDLPLLRPPRFVRATLTLIGVENFVLDVEKHVQAVMDRALHPREPGIPDRSRVGRDEHLAEDEVLPEARADIPLKAVELLLTRVVHNPRRKDDLTRVRVKRLSHDYRRTYRGSCYDNPISSITAMRSFHGTSTSYNMATMGRRTVRVYADDVYDFVRHHPGATRTTVVEAMAHAGVMTDREAHATLTLLRRQGQVAVTGRGDQARFWTAKRGPRVKGWLVVVYDGTGDLIGTTVLNVSQAEAKLYACERFRVLADAAAVVVKPAEA